MVRKAAVAGYFYPGRERELRQMIKELFTLKQVLMERKRS